jgi:hypothetical protein
LCAIFCHTYPAACRQTENHQAAAGRIGGHPVPVLVVVFVFLQGDAIIVVENVGKCLERGDRPIHAVRSAMPANSSPMRPDERDGYEHRWPAPA